MYKIILNGTDFIQDSVNNVVINPVLTEKSNSAGTLVYSIPYNDEHYKEYQELVTTVQVFNGNGSTPEFSGRLLSSDKTFDGMLKLTFEGDLALLNDVQYPPYDYTGSVLTFITNVVNYYNSKASSNHQINLGTITVEDPNEYIVRSNEDYSSCWEVINSKLVGMLGGYLYISYVRLENGSYSRYLNYVTDCGECTQTIEFGKNLLDLEHYIDATNVATRLIALGAESDEEGYTQPTYTVDTELESTYGIIELVNKWDDVTTQEALETKATEYAKSMVLRDVTINAKAIDLHFTDTELEEFRINKTITCTSKPHNVEASFVLTERTRNLNNPVQDNFSLGSEQKTLTASITKRTVEIVESQMSTSKVQDIVDSQTSIILGGSGGYVYFEKDEDGVVHEIYFMDSEDKSTAKNVLRMNNQGIGFSTTGINGTYTSAWTIDGTFNANFIKAGTLSGAQINIGNGAFKVDSKGKLTATSGNFKGDITGATGEFGGSIKATDISISSNQTFGTSDIYTGYIPDSSGNKYPFLRLYTQIPSSYASEISMSGDIIDLDVFNNSGGTCGSLGLGTTSTELYLYDGAGTYRGGILIEWSSLNIASQGTVYVNGTPFGSDRNLKRDIDDIDDSQLDVLHKFTPRKYRFNDNDVWRNGFIAQEVEDVYKELGIDEEYNVVFPDTLKSKYYALDYNGFVALLWRIVQKKDEELQELKSKVEDLETRLAKLEGVLNG